MEIHPTRVVFVKEVICHPCILNWLKFNYNGSVDSHTSGSGDIFRDNKGNFILGFAEPILFTNYLHAKFSVVFRAIEIVRERAWLKIETDSSLWSKLFQSMFWYL